MSLSTEPTPIEDEALPLESRATDRMTNYRWIILALIFFGTTLNYMDRVVIAILAPTLQKDYAISDVQYGYIGSIFGLAYAFGQLLSGGMLDRIGTRVGYALALSGWSICAMLTSLGRTALSFGIFRAMLGFSESPAFPAAARTCAEWFPQRQRAFAFGFVNAGTNMGTIAAPIIVPLVAARFGWQSAFVVTGAMGFLLLAFWIPLYRRPEQHPKVSQSELDLIYSDPPEIGGRPLAGVLDLRPLSFKGRLDGATAAGILVALGLLSLGVGPMVALLMEVTRHTAARPLGLAVFALSVVLLLWIVASTLIKWKNQAAPKPATNLVGYRRAWVFAMGKFITDPMWWFYMTWLPKFLYDRYGLDLKTIGLPLVIIYVMSDAGSIAGGWLSSRMIRSGYSVNVGRKTAFLVSSLFVVPIVLAQHVTGLWTAVLILGLATAGHQAFSSNLYTLCSDLFPKRAVASVAGFGGSFGWIGAGLFQLFVGAWVQKFHNYWGPFIAAAGAYLFAFGVIHLLSPRLEPAVIDDSN